MRRFGSFLLAVALASCTIGTAAPPPRAAKPGTRSGGTLTIGIGRPATIDPSHVFERWGRFVAGLLCDTLVSLDPVTGDPKPALAESWTVTNRGTQITFKLRKSARFHDGTAVTADDVAFALTRTASEEEGSNVADLLRPIAGWEFVHGDAEARDEALLDQLQGARAIGPNAVQISLRAPRADFIRVFAHPATAPQPRARVVRDPAAFAQQPVCTGPYMLERPWTTASTMTLVRAPSYHGANAAYTRGGRGYADRIVLAIRDLDAPAPSEDAGAVTGRVPAGGRTSVVGGTSYLEYIGLPVATRPFDRRAVRVALSQAIDRTAIVRDVYGGVRAPARGFLPPAMGSVSRDAACGTSAPAVADPARARATLGGVTLPPITIAYNPDHENERLVRAVAAQWRAAFNVDVRVVAVPWEQYIRRARASTGLSTPFRMGWEPPFVSPDEMLAPLFSSVSIGRDNLTRFADPRFDRALERDARTVATDEDVRRAYERLEDIVCEQMPAIPVVFGAHRYLVRADRIDSAASTMVDVTDGSLLARELFLRAG